MTLPRLTSAEPEGLVDLRADCLDLPLSLSSSPAVPTPRVADPQPLVIDVQAAPLLDGMESYGS